MADEIGGLIPLVVGLAVVKAIFDDDKPKSKKLFSEKKYPKKKGGLEW